MTRAASRDSSRQEQRLAGVQLETQPEQCGASDEFRLIADSAPVPMWVTALDRTRSFVNAAYVEFVGTDYDAALAFDWRTIIHPDDAATTLAASLAGEASLAKFTLEARYRRADGEWRWLQSVSQPHWDATGNHIGFIGVAHDVTAAKATIEAVREREEQLRAVVTQTTAGVAQVDRTGRFTMMNDRFCAITGRSRAELLGTTMQAITHPDDLARNVDLFERAVAEGAPYEIEKRYILPDGSIVWANNSVAVIRRGDGSPYGVLAVTIDVTEKRLAAQRQKLLIDELNHRVKNMLAIVQGIAQQSLRDGRDAASARRAFEGRLGALAAAHNLLTERSWGPVAIRRVIEAVTAPHAQIGVAGPDLTVPPKTAVSLALAMHELATNAVKYGALSHPDGRIAVEWRVEPGADRARLKLDWTETGGPPVEVPARRGFGTRMIERGLAAEFGGPVRIDFAREGVRCSVDAPLPAAAA